MRHALATLCAIPMLLLWSPAVAEDAAGHWIGKITSPIGVELTITAHIKAAVGGGYEGYAESPDQSLDPLPMTEVTATPDALAFAVPSVTATFAGRWDPAAKGWVGVLKQNAVEMPLTLVRGAAPPRPVVAGLDGDWAGVIAAPQGELRIRLHVKTGPDGTLALLESPDQTPMKLVAFLTHQGEAVSVTLRGIGGFFGTLSADGAVIQGEWRQGGGALPLTLKRAG